MDSISLSMTNEKLIHEIKYLLSQPPDQIKEELLQTLNKVYPFTLYPLSTPLPIELFQQEFAQNYIIQKAKSQSFAVQQNQKVIVEDLKKQLESYCYIILRGYMIIQKGSHIMHQEKFVDQGIKEKMVFNINEGKTIMKISKSGVYLKIHNIWLKMAIQKIKEKQKTYIKEKLLQVPFFANLSFQQFNQCCKKAYILSLGPGDLLLRQCQIPYNMYVVSEGELSLQKRVKFSKQQAVWKQVRSQLQKNNEFCQNLYEYLVREPSEKDKCFQVDFLIKEINYGQIICAKQTLNQSPLKYSIRSTLKTKIICIKYPDLYVLNEDRLSDIRLWPSPQIDQKKLRKKYYYNINWTQFKQYIKKQNNLAKLQRETFDQYLRKDVNLVQQRYTFYPNKVGQGKITSSPAGKILKMKQFSNKEQK